MFTPNEAPGVGVRLSTRYEVAVILCLIFGKNAGCKPWWQILVAERSRPRHTFTKGTYAACARYETWKTARVHEIEQIEHPPRKTDRGFESARIHVLSGVQKMFPARLARLRYIAYKQATKLGIGTTQASSFLPQTSSLLELLIYSSSRGYISVQLEENESTVAFHVSP